MIWLVWRQHRMQLLAALAGLVALGVLMVPTGIRMHAELERLGLSDCLAAEARTELVPNTDAAGWGPVTACQEEARKFSGRFGFLNNVGLLLWFLPLMAGLFWGAPLVAREIEQGTHRVVWTQGVSRTRWALAKFGLVGGGVLLVAASYALLVTWWRAPLDHVGVVNTAGARRFAFFMFDTVGVAPVGYTLFAVALGVLAGVITRKTPAAMAIAFVGYLGVRLGVMLMARQSYLEPLRHIYPTVPEEVPNVLTGDWVVRAAIYDAQDNLQEGGTLGTFAREVCLESNPGPCVAEYGAGAYNVELFQPADRFWLFQGIEAALFMVLAVVLLLAAFGWVRRRVA